MGLLSDHRVANLRRQYRLRAFVETGTWRGDGLLHALEQGFWPCFSIEASEQLAREAAKRVAMARGKAWWDIIIGDSVEWVPKLLVALRDHPTLWWLDAHLPDRYGTTATLLPLEAEVRAIVESPRPHGGDVLLMDDWRLYEDGPYGSGPFPGGRMGDPRPIKDLLAATHVLFIDERKEGALIALPRCDARPL